jgi:hypothetical protein
MRLCNALFMHERVKADDDSIGSSNSGADGPSDALASLCRHRRIRALARAVLEVLSGIPVVGVAE